jgi:hypothetical protein
MKSGPKPDLSKLTARAKQLLKQQKYKITYHALHDHPERNITAADIIEAIKIGGISKVEPREVAGSVKYDGADRYNGSAKTPAIGFLD